MLPFIPSQRQEFHLAKLESLARPLLDERETEGNRERALLERHEGN
jgi:hypothetical protein